MTALPCDHVKAAFNAYNADKKYADAWLQLFKTMSPELDAKALMGDYSAGELYEQTTLEANVSLTVQAARHRN